MAVQSDRWSSSLSINSADAIDLALSAGSSLGLRVSEQSDRRVLLKAGSQTALRLKGGWIASLKDFPVQIEISVVSIGDNACEIVVDARDSLGFGYKAGMKNKYQQAISKWMTEFRDLFASHAYTPTREQRSERSEGLPSSSSETGLSSELHQLIELHRDGHLSDAEFSAAKSKLLRT
jgi:hypothetical protein